MNPYVAEAKFVLQKDATERDIAKTAEQFIQEILKFEQQIREKTPSDSRQVAFRGQHSLCASETLLCPLLCPNYMSLCVRIGKIDGLESPLNA
jgi:hypothetical protein